MTVFHVQTALLLLFLFLLYDIKAQKKVFLVAGQSNAAGLGDSLLCPVCVPETAFEFFGPTGRLRPLKDPVGDEGFGFDRAKTGSAWPSFAKRYNELSQDTVVIIQAAKGGSSVNNRASPHLCWGESGHLWKAAVEKVNLWLKSSNSSLHGIAWVQGESDASYINSQQYTAKQYKQDLKSLFQRFRDNFGKHLNVYVVQVGLAVGESAARYKAIQLAQEEICREVPNAFLVYNLTKYFPTFGLMTDYIHYNQAGYNALGETVAEVIVNLERGIDLNPFDLNCAIYPNPSFGEMYLRFLNGGLYPLANLSVYNWQGALIKSVELRLNQDVLEVIPLSFLEIPPGAYYFCLHLGEQLFYARRHIIY